MKKIEAVGIVVTLAMAPPYVILMKSSGKPMPRWASARSASSDRVEA